MVVAGVGGRRHCIGRHHGGAFASAELILSEGAAVVAIVWCVSDELHGGGVVRCTVMKEVSLGRGGCLTCTVGDPMAGARGGRVYLLELQSLFPFIVGGPAAWCHGWFRWWSSQVGAGRLALPLCCLRRGWACWMLFSVRRKHYPTSCRCRQQRHPRVSFTSVGALLRCS
jgi:hypothetical protein